MMRLHVAAFNHTASHLRRSRNGESFELSKPLSTRDRDTVTRALDLASVRTEAAPELIDHSNRGVGASNTSKSSFRAGYRRSQRATKGKYGHARARKYGRSVLCIGARTARVGATPGCVHPRRFGSYRTGADCTPWPFAIRVRSARYADL